MRVQCLSASRNWGTWSTPRFWSSRTDTSLLQRKPGHGNWENISHFCSLQNRTVERGFLFCFSHPGKEEWLGVCQQYHSWTKSALVNHRHIGHGDRHAAAAQAFWQPCGGSSSCTVIPRLWKTFGPFAELSPSADLIGPCTCLQGAGTADFNKAKKLVYYQAIEPL